MPGRGQKQAPLASESTPDTSYDSQNAPFPPSVPSRHQHPWNLRFGNCLKRNVLNPLLFLYESPVRPMGHGAFGETRAPLLFAT